MSILRIRDKDGNVQEIPVIKGDTPVKGVDYYTEADKAEMVEEVTKQAASVSYKPQTLAEEQKAQARQNIGAVDVATANSIVGGAIDESLSPLWETMQNVADKAYVDNAVKGKSYELIETITLEEEMSVSRSATPDGKAYNFSSIMVKIAINGAAMSAGANIHYFAYSGTSKKIGSIWMSQVSGKYLARHEVFLDKGMWKVLYTNLSTNSGASSLTTFNTSTIGMMESEYPAVKYIMTDKLPAGTQIDVYGVWKDA